MPKEDELILPFAAAGLAYFSAHVAWASMEPGATVAINVMSE